MKKISVLLLFLLTMLFSGISQNSLATLNQSIDSWHKAAADADSDIFFNFMDSSCVYIGTDASERWSKKEFFQFAKPYFDRGKAWDFKAYDRIIFFADDGRTAWFDELLNTWMGICRGSGVADYKNGMWKLQHYHLSVTVPNEKIHEFIKLLSPAPEVNKE